MIFSDVFHDKLVKDGIIAHAVVLVDLREFVENRRSCFDGEAFGFCLSGDYFCCIILETFSPVEIEFSCVHNIPLFALWCITCKSLVILRFS